MLMRHAAFGDQPAHIFVVERGAAEQQRARDLNLIVGKQKDEIVRRLSVIGEPLGQRHADGNFDVLG